tara:strand:- start:56 stop:301 length:246 start_codon:yes stop_codon:yes gene_type:complete
MFTYGCIFDLIQFIGETMFKNKNAQISDLSESSRYFRSTQTDVLNILKRNRLEEKQLKIKNIIYAAAIVSVFVISGLLISL